DSAYDLRPRADLPGIGTDRLGGLAEEPYEQVEVDRWQHFGTKPACRFPLGSGVNGREIVRRLDDRQEVVMTDQRELLYDLGIERFHRPVRLGDHLGLRADRLVAFRVQSGQQNIAWHRSDPVRATSSHPPEASG